MQRTVDAHADSDAEAWAIELWAMAAWIDGGAPEHYKSATAARLREAAEPPPPCEEAFRYRLCVVMGWSPQDNMRDLDNAVARARDYVGLRLNAKGETP